MMTTGRLPFQPDEYPVATWPQRMAELTAELAEERAERRRVVEDYNRAVERIEELEAAGGESVVGALEQDLAAVTAERDRVTAERDDLLRLFTAEERAAMLAPLPVPVTGPEPGSAEWRAEREGNWDPDYVAERTAGRLTPSQSVPVTEGTTDV